MKSRYRKTKIAGRTVSVHRHLAEQRAGRPLTRDEVVHHINGDRYDNRLENLEVLSHREHAQHHVRKHTNEKACVMCARTFTPPPTKRARQVTCSRYCLSLRSTEHSLEREERRRAAREVRA